MQWNKFESLKWPLILVFSTVNHYCFHTLSSNSWILLNCGVFFFFTKVACNIYFYKLVRTFMHASGHQHYQVRIFLLPDTLMKLISSTLRWFVRFRKQVAKSSPSLTFFQGNMFLMKNMRVFLERCLAPCILCTCHKLVVHSSMLCLDA